jgi:selenocysteine lyase/cysteine desulfurase
MLGIHALSASLSLLHEIGLRQIEAQLLERTSYLLSELKSRQNVELLTRDAPGRTAGIVTFRPRHTDAATMHRYLAGNDIVCAPRGGGVRFSPHFYIPLQQLEFAIKSLDDFRPN